MPADASSSRIGTELAGFRIESVLGRGGMSVVYVAEQVSLGRKVALKILVHQIIAIDETFRERFLQESHLAAHLDHPNIIPIYDAGEADDCLYIAMRYIEGRDLEQVLAQDGPLSLGRTIFILEQVASALDAAHERGLVHRDVKPANILLMDDSDRIYLTDFGVAKPTTSSGLTRTGFFIGTPNYCAPEQIEGHPVDERTDVYALGAVLYACLTGTAPYAKDTEVAVLHAHLKEPPPKLSDSRRTLPRGLDRVIATAMAKEKDERYATCGDLIAAARAASLDRPISLPSADMTIITSPEGAVAGTTRAAEVIPVGEPVGSVAPAEASPAAPDEQADPVPTADAPPPETPPPPVTPDGQEPPDRPPRRLRGPLLVGGLVAAVVALAVALGVVLATNSNDSSGGAAGEGSAAHASFTVPLASSAEVPQSVSNASSGSAQVTIDGTKVCWDIKLSGVDMPDAAHIHTGGSAVSGPVLVPLGAGFTPKGCTTTSAAAVNQILADPAGHYVNVHSMDYPEGAVRGQLERPVTRATLSAVLASSAEIPPTVSNTSSGTAEITITGTKLCWDLKVNGVDQPNAAHIHTGGSAVSGPVLVPLGATYKPKDCTTTTAAAVKQILADPAGHYVNVHSVTYPDGAVRGQLKVLSATGAGATQTTQVSTGLAGLVPNDVFKNCVVQPKPRAGAVQTAACVPPAGSTTPFPNRLELSLFANERATLAAYTAERKKVDVGTNFGRCDGTSWGGEGKWFHAPGGPGQPPKRGGRRFCYFDGNTAVMVWTHGKYGQESHVDFLGIAREEGSDHARLYDWWRFWHHRMGKCLQEGCVAKP